MTDREKVIKGLECCVLFKGFECTNRNCPYWKDCSAASTSNELLHDVLAMLKAQEPMVMTLEDAINSEMVWTECSNGDGGFGTCRLVEIYGMVAAEVFMLKNKYPERNRLNPEKYLREWRCWDKKPTPEQMEATPWMKN